MIPIRPDRKYYVPYLNDERQYHLTSNTDHGAKFNIAFDKMESWDKLEKQGWRIGEYWGSEYE